MKAYRVTDATGSAVVVFADTPGAAKAVAFGDDFFDSEYVDLRATREPKYDEYSPGPVPGEVRIHDGWIFLCLHCGAHVNEDTDERILSGGSWFCCKDCVTKFDKKLDALKNEGAK